MSWWKKSDDRALKEAYSLQLDQYSLNVDLITPPSKPNVSLPLTHVFGVDPGDKVRVAYHCPVTTILDYMSDGEESFYGEHNHEGQTEKEIMYVDRGWCEYELMIGKAKRKIRVEEGQYFTFDAKVWHTWLASPDFIGRIQFIPGLKQKS